MGRPDALLIDIRIACACRITKLAGVQVIEAAIVRNKLICRVFEGRAEDA